MSKTPRTDEHILHHGNGNWHPSAFVLASFARQLETELAEARAEIERKDETIDACSIMLSARESLTNKQSKLIEQMRELLQLKNAILGHCRFVTYPPKKIIEKLEKIEAALLAAERGE